MDRKWIWLIPYLNGIIVGTILLVTDGFDLKAVIGPWLFIGLVFFVYTCILRALPVRGTRLGHTCGMNARLALASRLRSNPDNVASACLACQTRRRSEPWFQCVPCLTCTRCPVASHLQSFRWR